MSRSIKKLSYRYNYLKLELEEVEETIESFISDWNSTFGKYFIKDKVELWQNTETGELKDSPPDFLSKKKKKNQPPKKLKEIYRKLSSKLHPDKGGSSEKFNELKEAYQQQDMISLMSIASDNDINIKIEDDDYDLLEKSVLNLEKKIKRQTQSMLYMYYTGDEIAKKAIIHQIEIMTGKKIDADSLI